MRFPKKSSSKSATALKLPAELWLLVFEFVTALSIDPAGYCNHLNFPYIDRHHLFPCDYPSLVGPSLRDLRQVCRYFSALLQPSPSFYMSDSESAIPATTRALYITSKYTVQACLQRLLTDPSISGRIVILNLVSSHRPPPTALGFLFDNGSSLPAVRTLALCVHMDMWSHSAHIPRFLGRLNEAFPLLSCLILHGSVHTSFPDAVVEFKNLVVMDWGDSNPHESLRFPRLRHVAFGCLLLWHWKGYHIEWPQLESLLLLNVDNAALLGWNSLPNLQLLGVPARYVDSVPSPPRGHPLRHLCIYVGMEGEEWRYPRYEEELAWFEGLAGRVPMVSRISLMFGPRSGNDVPCIGADFLDADLEGLGFVENYPTFEAVRGGCRVLNRIDRTPKDDSLYTGSNRFLRFASRKLHI